MRGSRCRDWWTVEVVADVRSTVSECCANPSHRWTTRFENPVPLDTSQIDEGPEPWEARGLVISRFAAWKAGVVPRTQVELQPELEDGVRPGDRDAVAAAATAAT